MAAAVAPAEAHVEDDGLQEGLQELSCLATVRLGMKEVLIWVAGFAVRAIPGAEGLGLTLLEDDRAVTVVTTAAFARQVDDIQYSRGQGPGLTAARQRHPVLSGSLGGDARWPRFWGGGPARGAQCGCRCR